MKKTQITTIPKHYKQQITKTTSYIDQTITSTTKPNIYYPEKITKTHNTKRHTII